MAERYCAENLVFHAGQRTLIDDVSLTLSQGELVALIGPNGAGKSTLLRLLTGYLTPASGRCSLAGTPLADWPTETLACYRAVMRQNTQPGFDWPVEAVVGMGRAPWTRSPEASVVEEVMAITGCLPWRADAIRHSPEASSNGSSSLGHWPNSGATAPHAAGCFLMNRPPHWISSTSNICCA